MTTIHKTPKSALIVHELPTRIIQLMADITDNVDLDFHPPIVVFGRVCHQQRSVGFYSNESIGYKYSNKLNPSRPLTAPLQELLDFINDKFKTDFNGILINMYANGEEYIGKHSDDELGLNKDCGVIAMSFGAVRKFRIRDKNTGNIVLDLPTSNYQIIQMAGCFQDEFTHEIPIEKKIKDRRFSFTFRKHLI